MLSNSKRPTVKLAVTLCAAAIAIASLTGCLDRKNDDSLAAPEVSWEGPTDGVWGDSINENSYLVGFMEPYEVSRAPAYRTVLTGLPEFGPLENGEVRVTGTFEVTRVGDYVTTKPSFEFTGWMAGVKEVMGDFDENPRYYSSTECDSETLALGETTSCRSSFRATPEEIANFHWRLGVSDVAAWPGQIVPAPLS